MTYIYIYKDYKLMSYNSVWARNIVALPYKCLILNQSLLAMFSNCYLLQILSWIKFTHIIERSSWLCYVIKTFHTVKISWIFLKNMQLCVYVFGCELNNDVPSISFLFFKRLILAARSVISNRCLEIQNSLPMLRMHYQCT